MVVVDVACTYRWNANAALSPLRLFCMYMQTESQSLCFFFSRKSLFLFLACKCGNDDSLSATSLEKNEIKIWRKRTIHLGRMSSICYRENLQVSPLTSEWEKEKNEWHVPNSNVYWIRSRCLIQVTVSWKIWRIVDFRAEISSSNWFVDSFFFLSFSLFFTSTQHRRLWKLFLFFSSQLHQRTTA